MKIRYGKWILTRAEHVLKHLADKDDALALAEKHRNKTATYVGSLVARHQPYSTGSHDRKHDLSTCPTEELAERLLGRLKGNLWCTSCRTPWPCADLGPLRALARELRRPSDEPLPELPAAPSSLKYQIGVTL